MKLKYFFGTYEISLVTGGQMNLPAKIRKSLNGKDLVLTTGFDKCIFGFVPGNWEKMVQSGLDKPVFTNDGRTVRRQFFSAADIIEFDNQGRIIVPANLREYADLKAKVMVIGAGDHFEIWAKDEWNKIKNEFISHSGFT